jgi:hypothetical protein
VQHETVVIGDRFQLRLRNHGKKSNRISAGFAPEFGVDPAQQFDGIQIPGPPEVPDHFFRKSEGWGNFWIYLK